MQWHDDGHAIAEDTVHENAFWNADLTEAADHLVEMIREVRPQVLVTYDQFGGYGHPDHIQAHRVAMYAAQLAAVPSYRPRPRRALGHRQDLLGGDVGEPDARGAAGSARPATPRAFEGMDPDGPLPPFVTADENLSAAVDGTARRPEDGGPRGVPDPDQPDGPFFALSNNVGSATWGVEFYRIAKGSWASSARTGWRPTCSPASSPDLRERGLRRWCVREAAGGGASVLLGLAVGVASVALHTEWWTLGLAAATTSSCSSR